VTQTAAVLLRAFIAAADRPVAKLERFCVLLASAVHDLGHPGVNNDFLVRTRHRLATLYNDRSVNENYHCATAFHLAHSVRVGAAAAAAAAADGEGGDAGARRPLTDLIGAPPSLQRAAADDGHGGPAALLPAHGGRRGGGGSSAPAPPPPPPPPPPPASPGEQQDAAVVGDGGLFSRFPRDEYARARALVVGMVLSTDMGVHFDLLAAFRAAAEREGGRPPGGWADRALAYQLLVHLADLANPSRPFPLALRWAENVVTEFLAQGAHEAASGVTVSAMCDRDRVSMPRAQLNFVEVFMRPTLEALAPAVPAFAAAAGPCLEDTVAKWEWLEGAGVRLPSGACGAGARGEGGGAYPPLPGELEASRPWEEGRGRKGAGGAGGGGGGGGGGGVAAAGSGADAVAVAAAAKAHNGAAEANGRG
jgi:hypothetical protein